MSQLMAILASKEKDTAAKNFAKQLAWQDTMVRLFTSDHEDSSSTQTLPHRNSLSIPRISESLIEEPGEKVSEGDLPLNSSTPKRPDQLTIAVSNDSLLEPPSLHTPSTPMFVQVQEFEDLSTSEDDRSLSVSRSSSASVEDLSALGQRMASQRHNSYALHQSSVDSVLSTSESAGDISAMSDLESRRSSSVTQSESMQRVWDALGCSVDAVEQIEEHCQNVLVCLTSIMWKGLDGSDKAVWKVRR